MLVREKQVGTKWLAYVFFSKMRNEFLVDDQIFFGIIKFKAREHLHSYSELYSNTHIGATWVARQIQTI